jgi:hypothetical protein
MADVSSSLVGRNDFQEGGVRPVPVSTAFPGYGAGAFGDGANWQDWNPTDDMVGDKPVTSGVTGSGHVSGGIRTTSGIDAWPGMRPSGWGTGYAPGTPAWAKGDGVDAPADPAVSSPSRPWQSGPRPSDLPAGSVNAFPGGGQLQAAPDSTGETGPRRLRRDDSSGGTLP